MNPDKRRLKALARLKRLRAIESMAAQRELGEARQFQDKLRDLEERSATMAQEYSTRMDHASGGALAQSLGLAREMARVSKTAERDGAAAEEQIERSRQKMARLDKQQERIEERIVETRGAIAMRTERSEGEAQQLARPLLSTRQNSG